MPESKEQLEQILKDIAESICGEWCSYEHEGLEAVHRHAEIEFQAIQSLITKARIEGQKEAFDRVFALTPAMQFKDWKSKYIADYFLALGALERELKDSSK